MKKIVIFIFLSEFLIYQKEGIAFYSLFKNRRQSPFVSKVALCSILLILQNLNDQFLKSRQFARALIDEPQEQV